MANDKKTKNKNNGEDMGFSIHNNPNANHDANDNDEIANKETNVFAQRRENIEQNLAIIDIFLDYVIKCIPKARLILFYVLLFVLIYTISTWFYEFINGYLTLSFCSHLPNTFETKIADNYGHCAELFNEANNNINTQKLISLENIVKGWFVGIISGLLTNFIYEKYIKSK